MELGKIYNMNCMEGMKQFPDKYFELAIVDPPYGIGMSRHNNLSRGKLAKAKNYTIKDWDDYTPNKEYYEELFRISKNQVIWGGNYFIEYLSNTPCFIVWDKNNGTNDFADCEIAWTSFKTAVRKFQFTWNGMLQGDMKNKELRIHPTQKPVALYKWLLKNYATQGDIILDTHLGSASSVIACLEMGFDYIGFELDEEYFKNAQKRIDQYKSQYKLFA